MGVANEPGGLVEAMTLLALNAGRLTAVIEFLPHQTFAFAEAGVIDSKLRLLLWWAWLGRSRGGSSGRMGVQQGLGEPLGVGVGDETARSSRVGQDARLPKGVELPGRATRTKNPQFVAYGVDLRQRKLPQHGVENLR